MKLAKISRNDSACRAAQRKTGRDNSSLRITEINQSVRQRDGLERSPNSVGQVGAGFYRNGHLFDGLFEIVGFDKNNCDLSMAASIRIANL